MTLYVDDMQAPFGPMVMCHMLAGSDNEFHAMAVRIGIDRRHWQSPHMASGSHCNISPAKRALAVAAGAVEISQRQAGAMSARRRQTGELGCSLTTRAWLTSSAARRRAAPVPCAIQDPHRDAEPFEPFEPFLDTALKFETALND